MGGLIQSHISMPSMEWQKKGKNTPKIAVFLPSCHKGLIIISKTGVDIYYGTGQKYS